MELSKAIALKLIAICDERKLSINQLANMCLLTQSTVENLVLLNSKNPKILTIMRICKGLNMSLNDFFNDELFHNLDLDIKKRR